MKHKDSKDHIWEWFKSFPSKHGLHSVIFAVLASTVFVFEFFNNFDLNLNTPIKNWVDTATYFNNILSPILLFASILLLYRTWKDSKEALELQRTELIENKEIFQQQLSAQKFKDDLEIFSRRINALDKKFVSVINESEIKYAITKFLEELNSTFDFDSSVSLLDKFYLKVKGCTEVVESTNEEKVSFLVQFVLGKSYKVDELLKSYLFHYIEHGEMNLASLINSNNINDVSSITIGKILTQTVEYKRRINTLSRVLNKASQVEAREYDTYIEEVILHFDTDLILLLHNSLQIKLDHNVYDSLSNNSM
tara:strand:+ start:2740 stop:3663 length:924 start_codon:yes stop_codon:yes gene_type:complete